MKTSLFYPTEKRCKNNFGCKFFCLKCSAGWRPWALENLLRSKNKASSLETRQDWVQSTLGKWQNCLHDLNWNIFTIYFWLKLSLCSSNHLIIVSPSCIFWLKTYWPLCCLVSPALQQLLTCLLAIIVCLLANVVEKHGC